MFAPDVIKVRLTFEENLIGGVPADKEIYKTYHQGKMHDQESADDVADELETLPDGGEMERGKTTFHKLDDGTPIIYDYVVKGYMKDVCSMLRRTKGTESSKIRAFKKIIDGLVFVSPRRIPVHMTGEMEEIQRPLRADTPQGPRVALANSDMIPAGSYVEFEIHRIGTDDVTDEMLQEWFDYGIYRGFGQWRNGGWGRFSWERLD